MISKILVLNNTTRLIATFKNWNKQPADPQSITFSIYDNNTKEKISEVAIPPENRMDVGVYYYDYIPDKLGAFIYEWLGVIDGTPAVKRDVFAVRLLQQ